MKVTPALVVEKHDYDFPNLKLLSQYGKPIVDRENLQKSLSKMFVLAQIFGFLPVQGVIGPDYRSLNFNWKTSKVAYSIFTILGACFLTIMQINKIVTTGMDLLEINRLCFNLCGVVSGVLFLKFAKNWPKLMREWSAVEMTMLSYGWPSGLNRKLNILLIVLMSFAAIEYILMQSDRLVEALKCKNDAGSAFTYFLGNMSFSNTFTVIDFNVFFGLLLQFINLQQTFTWTFSDLFIMLLSTALAYRFQQITIRLQSVTDAKIEAEIIWKNLREDYNRLCKLCRKVDDEISYIVLLAFSSDLFFILIQLFNSLRPIQNDLERIYFYFSFGLLIARTISLCLFAAKVNDESRKPLVILNSVPSSIYNLEIQRFVQQIGTSEVAITGRNFFSITRGLILSIAGAIVTYELVLIQFNDNLLKKTTMEQGTCPVFI